MIVEALALAHARSVMSLVVDMQLASVASTRTILAHLLRAVLVQCVQLGSTSTVVGARAKAPVRTAQTTAWLASTQMAAQDRALALAVHVMFLLDIWRSLQVPPVAIAVIPSQRQTQRK